MSITSDPNYRRPSAYSYADLRDIKLHCILSDSILWDYEIEIKGRGKCIVGGFSGPFEALAAALQHANEVSE